MKKIVFSDIFSNDYLTLVTAYRKLISDILDTYDVAVFMARKAICFYTAMKSNGEIENRKCHVISSRVVDYDSLNRFRGKRIAVIDDVVVKGDSMNEIASKFTQAKIQADYYVAACEKNFPERLTSKDVVLKPSYSHYSEENIYQLAGLITQYIEASMCSFNIDSPIYDICCGSERIKIILDMIGAPDLTSGNQRKNKIESRVIYFSAQENQYTEGFFDVLDRAIIKIRFYIKENSVIAVPFVLLPGDVSFSIEKFYALIQSPVVDKLIDCGNARVCDENKLKIVSYLLSMSLMKRFARQYDIRLMKHLENDIIQFDQNIDDILSQKQKKDLDNIFCEIQIMNTDFSPFIFSEYMRGFYVYISHFNSEQQIYQNRLGEQIGRTSEEDYLNRLVFTYEDLYDAIYELGEKVSERKVYISSVIDVLIDRGFIVPSIVHYPNGNSIRAYKMGEYSKLTRDQINAFARMLYISRKYRKRIG